MTLDDITAIVGRYLTDLGLGLPDLPDDPENEKAPQYTAFLKEEALIDALIDATRNTEALAQVAERLLSAVPDPVRKAATGRRISIEKVAGRDLYSFHLRLTVSDETPKTGAWVVLDPIALTVANGSYVMAGDALRRGDGHQAALYLADALSHLCIAYGKVPAKSSPESVKIHYSSGDSREDEPRMVVAQW